MTRSPPSSVSIWVTPGPITVCIGAEYARASLAASRTVEDRYFDPTPTLTVAELAQRIGTVIDRAFEDEVWLRGEIQSLNPNRSASGALYFDLVEPAADGDRAIARVGVVLREENRRAINAQLRSNQAFRMEDGLDVRIRGLEFWRRSGQLRFRMTAIDPDYTLGRLANERERVLTTLRAEGLVDRNAGLPLAEVPLRVALVTSISAACADFLHELEASGFGWSVHVIDTRVQGIDAGPSLVAALRRAVTLAPDVVALVRGGGARTSQCSTARPSPGRSPPWRSPSSPGSATRSTAAWPTRSPTPASRPPPPARRTWWRGCGRSASDSIGLGERRSSKPEQPHASTGTSSSAASERCGARIGLAGAS